jgi:hypothetical protein
MVGLKSETPLTLESEDKELNSYLRHLWTAEVPRDMPILTDDYAPVAYYLLEIYSRPQESRALQRTDELRQENILP